MQQSIGDQLSSTLTQTWAYLPTLLAALGILVLGWILALMFGGIVRRAFLRVQTDSRLGGWLRGDKTVGPIDVAGAAGRIAFWTGMLFVLVAFFQVLSLTQVTQPLNALLDHFAAFLPRLFGAALLLAIAWLIASALRRVVRVLVQRSRLEERLTVGETSADLERPSLAKAGGDAVYWLVLLLFLPGVLGALSVEGMMLPVQSAAQQVLEFVPRLVGAALILTVGWFVARFIRDVVSNLLASIGVDRLGDRAGMPATGDLGGLSKVLGLVAYVLVLIPVVVSSLSALRLTAVTGPATAMLEQMMGAVPQIFAATLLLVFAFVVGRFVADLVESFLRGVSFDQLLERMGLARVNDDSIRPSGLVAKLVLVGIVFFAAMEASAVMGFDALVDLLHDVAVFGGQALLALLILGLGFYFAGLAQEAIRATANKAAPALATAARIGVISIAAAMALQQLNVGSQLITVAFAAVFGGAAVAAAIAFGLGGRETAADLLDGWRGKTVSVRPTDV